jgi:hypothetical protein
MAGANPTWIARQMGYANSQMLFRVYAKWIDGGDKSRERDKFNLGFGHRIDYRSEDNRAIKYLTGGERGIRTLDTPFWAYAPLAGECLRPLGHLSGCAILMAAVRTVKNDAAEKSATYILHAACGA